MTLERYGNIVVCSSAKIGGGVVANHLYTNTFLATIPVGYRPQKDVFGSFSIVSATTIMGNFYIVVKPDGKNHVISSASISGNAEYNIHLVWATSDD